MGQGVPGGAVPAKGGQVVAAPGELGDDAHGVACGAAMRRRAQLQRVAPTGENPGTALHQGGQTAVARRERPALVGIDRRSHHLGRHGRADAVDRRADSVRGGRQ